MVVDVVNVSCTGALIRTEHQRPPGTQWPLLLEVADTPVQLTARVVRCEPVPGPLSTATRQFALALRFVNPSSEAQAHLERVCRSGRRADGDARRIQVSLERRCPKCQSRDVVKDSRRHYSCGQCGRMFVGFRIGIIRFAR
jgi:ribosomal protein S27AE